MKKLLSKWGAGFAGLAIILACLAPVTVINTGCVSPGNGTNSQQTIDAVAIILRGAARNGAALAIQDNPETKAYFELVASGLSTFVTGKDYSPGAFQTNLLAVASSQSGNQYVQIAIGTVIDLYQLYYGLYVKNAVDGNDVAKAFLVAIQDGLNQALGKPVSTRYYYRAKTGSWPKANPPVILPRPMKN